MIEKYICWIYFLCVKVSLNFVAIEKNYDPLILTSNVFDSIL